MPMDWEPPVIGFWIGQSPPDLAFEFLPISVKKGPWPVWVRMVFNYCWLWAALTHSFRFRFFFAQCDIHKQIGMQAWRYTYELFIAPYSEDVIKPCCSLMFNTENHCFLGVPSIFCQQFRIHWDQEPSWVDIVKAPKGWLRACIPWKAKPEEMQGCDKISRVLYGNPWFAKFNVVLHCLHSLVSWFAFVFRFANCFSVSSRLQHCLHSLVSRFGSWKVWNIFRCQACKETNIQEDTWADIWREN